MKRELDEEWTKHIATALKKQNEEEYSIESGKISSGIFRVCVGCFVVVPVHSIEAEERYPPDHGSTKGAKKTIINLLCLFVF